MSTFSILSYFLTKNVFWSIKYLPFFGCANFLIIDDDKSLNLLPAHLKSHLIQTSSSVGLSADDLTIVA
ncbi:MAG: hypothetical protein DI538_18995 [Azospira oryzae]|nr:MAG: hypothetical protein DI538_18995 [Azospira oryzae]